jgi:hypothetical protein
LRLIFFRFLAPAVMFAGVCSAHAQAVPTASANIRLSAFAGVSANYTGVELAKNGDVVAGVDIGFRPFAGFFPAIEARGMYPIDKGHLVAQENALVGIRLGRHKENFNPYGDVLFGRGKLDFATGLTNPAGTFLVLSNTTNVLSLGGGLDYSLSPHFAAKGDFQFQKYNTPVSASGSVYSKVFTVGIVYRIGTGGGFPKH